MRSVPAGLDYRDAAEVIAATVIELLKPKSGGLLRSNSKNLIDGGRHGSDGPVDFAVELMPDQFEFILKILMEALPVGSAHFIQPAVLKEREESAKKEQKGDDGPRNPRSLAHARHNISLLSGGRTLAAWRRSSRVRLDGTLFWRRIFVRQRSFPGTKCSRFR